MRDRILARFVEDLRAASDHTRDSRRYYAVKFLDFAGDPPWDRGTVLAFDEELRREGYSPGTRRTIYSITKRVFDAAKAVHEKERRDLLASVNPQDPSAAAEMIEALATEAPSWPMGKRDTPVVESRDVVKPALEMEEMAAMIATAREGRLKADEAAFLALSSTYGMRREELARVRPQDLNWEEETVWVDTIKRGEKREHLIPEEIVPYLAAHDFSRKYEVYQLSHMWRVIEYKAGVDHEDGAGWHSPRRLLDTTLLDLLPVPTVKHFFRWKMGTSSEMPLLYFSKKAAEVDREVFAVHPFLPFWR